jgi:hypothetical protein
MERSLLLLKNFSVIIDGYKPRCSMKGKVQREPHYLPFSNCLWMASIVHQKLKLQTPPGADLEKRVFFPFAFSPPFSFHTGDTQALSEQSSYSLSGSFRT